MLINISSMKIILLCIMLDVNTVFCKVMWSRWLWSSTDDPLNMRKNGVNYKQRLSVSSNGTCECPPNKECTPDYKINEDILHFQKLRGIINDREFRRFHEDNFLNVTNNIQQRIRRNNMNEECCCPKLTIEQPAFITDKRFDAVIERFKSYKTKSN
ncbi:uncharacterized protein LOC126979097 [Leptidea sinapis]|uniref:uncharacterized protein LOC126979097 n=1 Tax=Leptidea sinapis TaxID=189913 RepID=UPI0021C43280|nr:uncharacterized protein LOC126979097 [Leptidea sinapis]